MKAIFILRNGNKYGPYNYSSIVSYINSGQLLLLDMAIEEGANDIKPLRYFVKKHNLKVKIEHRGGLVEQLKDIGSELIVPRNMIVNRQWISDMRLMMLSAIGLFPLLLSYLPIEGLSIFYLVSLFFSSVWGMFFYNLFKTPQVTIKAAIVVFFISQFFIFICWDVIGLPALNPFYNFVDMPFPFSLIGYTFGVGLTEELAKVLPVYLIIRKAKEPLIPQSVLYYGLMSGIAFGVYEGVEYQITVNVNLDYANAFFYNIARLTSLPFLHAVWCGIAAYFVAFANLYPKYRISLYFLSLAIPSLLHGFYDTFCGTMLGLFMALPITFIGVILLMSYLKQGVNYQSKLSNT